MSKNILTSAKELVDQREAIQTQIETHLAPFLAKYKELMLELNHHNYDHRDLSVETFNEIDREFFSFTSEEVYEYGDYYTPTLNLPFAFVEDPEAYAVKARQDEAYRKERETAKTAKGKAERVERLKEQLAEAQAELDKAEQGNDPIKLTATRNHVESLSR